MKSYWPRTRDRTLKHSAQDTSPQIAQNPRKKILGPSALTLAHRLCVLDKNIWTVYASMFQAGNQGSDEGASVSLSRLRQNPDEKPDPLYIVKREAIDAARIVSTFVKPSASNVVTLHCAFRHDDFVYTVYEEMDLSLTQVLSFDLERHSLVFDTSHYKTIYAQVGCILQLLSVGIP